VYVAAALADFLDDLDAGVERVVLELREAGVRF